MIDKDIENNLLIVGWGKECERREFLVEDVNWITSEVCIRTPRMVEESVNRIDCKVRIRHLGEFYPCRLKINGEKVMVVLKEPAWGVAPGQVAVFYGGEEVLGGGVITK